jgi:hypothetical protein
MGSGFKTFTAGAVLTASDVNNYLMEQSIMYFATTGARDTAITSPEEGMVAFIGSNDVNEGLYVYHGATGGWRKGPGWNAPWGYMAHIAQSATVTTSGTTELTICNTSSFTAVSNRLYLLTGTISGYGTSGDDFTFRLRNNSAAGTVLLAGNVNVKPYPSNQLIGVVSIAAGASNGIYMTMQRSAGTGTFTSNYIADPAQITLTDIGPSGAPA